MTTGESSRIHGMDVWRSLLLIGGVFVHVAALNNNDLFNFIERSSNMFRMEAYFAISGFFAALTLSRTTDQKHWLWQRTLMLALPLTTGLLLLIPLTHYLIEVIKREPGYLDGFYPFNPRDWHIHLWFLITLLLLTPVGAALKPVIARFARHDLTITPLRRHLLVVALWLGGIGITVAATVALGFLPFARLGSFVIRQTFYFAIFFLSGYLAFASASFRGWLLRLPRWTYVLAAVLFIGYHVLGVVDVPRGWRSIAFWIVRPLTGLVGCSLIFTSAFALEKPSRLLNAMSDASYTIYLLHIPVIVLLALLTYSWYPALSIYAIAALLVPATVLTTFCIHVLLVKRSRILRLLLNGRMSVSTPRSKAVAH